MFEHTRKINLVLYSKYVQSEVTMTPVQVILECICRSCKLADPGIGIFSSQPPLTISPQKGHFTKLFAETLWWVNMNEYWMQGVQCRTSRGGIYVRLNFHRWRCWYTRSSYFRFGCKTGIEIGQAYWKRLRNSVRDETSRITVYVQGHCYDPQSGNNLGFVKIEWWQSP